ncbi:MAG TPA: O-antigen ligase family protein [Promineifilum sp.]
MPARMQIAGQARSSVVLLALALGIGLAIARLPLPMAAGLLVVAAVALLTIFNPLFGLGLALLLGPFGALEKVILGDSLFDSGQLSLLLTLAVWIASGMARRRLVIPRVSFNLPWFLFVIVASFSLPGAASIELGLIELLKWLEIGLIVWLIVDLASDPDRGSPGFPAVMRTILALLFIAGSVQALIGIWQFGLRGHGPEHFLVLSRFYRAYGTFEQPNPFGGYMNLFALLAIGTALGLGIDWIRRRRGAVQSGHLTPFRLWFSFALFCVVVGSLALILSWSRGAWLGFLAGAIVCALFVTRRFWLGALFVSTAVVLVMGGLAIGLNVRFAPAEAVVGRLGGFREEFALGDVRGVDINDENYAVIERLAHWQAAVGMTRDNLWTGVGFGNYAAAYPGYDLLNFPDALGHAHNYYLNLLAETGLPGLVAYLIFWLAIAAQTIRMIRLLAWPERGVAVGLLAAWVALATHHLVDKLYVNNIYVHVGVMFGLLQLFGWPGFWTGGEQRLLQNHVDPVKF